ncbi:MCE family protein [Saccharomonospora xinjiangensis]|uniref:Virulence factor Mce family protein n=1 Tax=Saccharomonospora xinjiangensis XJ-54 TaxID=882086 RepID=I0UZK1_9PSEU|nr:MCE family protein [Saccharomonospora xinjiangensis]EID53304.1 virulence factor Mce family protein [Saccharomonospora xinjiangensis XJ-54]
MRSLVAPLVKSLVFVLVTTLATVVLALSISNIGVDDRTSYSAVFTDVTSLNPGDDVRIAGVRVGQVDELEIVDAHLARVRFSIERGQRLPADVTAVIRYRNMLGQRYIALERGEQPGTGHLGPGAEIPLERTRPALDLTELFHGFQPLFSALDPEEVNQLSGEIVQVLQGESGTVESLLAHTGSLTATLADRDKVIGDVITNLNTVLGTIGDEGDALSSLVSTLQELVTGLAADREAIGDSVEGMAALTTATSELFEVSRRPLKESIAGLREVSETLVSGSDELERFLVTTPEKFTEIGRTASYGSFLNTYLCDAVLLTDPPATIADGPLPARCDR